MTKYVGILTAGGDTPGLNAALRGLGKTAHGQYNMQMIGFYDGFMGLLHDRTVELNESALSGILTVGGTILGTSREKPDKMLVGGKLMDMTDAMVETYKRHHLDVLVCIGGGGTHKNAYKLMQKGLNIITMPKSIDNDVAMTDTTLGFDTALGIATDAIDRLHSTAHSHHRIIVVEVMGHNAGWLPLGAGIAGGADVILIPEIPYDVQKVAGAILERSRGGKRFSIVAVSEGAISKEDAVIQADLLKDKEKAKDKNEKEAAAARLLEFQATQTGKTFRLAQQLEQLTGLEFARHHFRIRPARRHPLCSRPDRRDRAGQLDGCPDRKRRQRRHGRDPRPIDRAGAIERSGRQAPHRSPGPPLAQNRPPGWHVFGGMLNQIPLDFFAGLAMIKYKFKLTYWPTGGWQAAKLSNLLMQGFNGLRIHFIFSRQSL